MKLHLSANGNTLHEQLLLRRIAERIPVTPACDGYKIELCVDPLIGAPESYRILSNGNGYRVIGACSMGLFFGIGKLLHSAKWTDTEMHPVPTDGTVTPACSFRAMYFS